MVVRSLKLVAVSVALLMLSSLIAACNGNTPEIPDTPDTPDDGTEERFVAPISINFWGGRTNTSILRSLEVAVSIVSMPTIISYSEHRAMFFVRTL